MGDILYGIAIVLVLLWAIGFFVFSIGAIIHLLLVVAVISVIFRVIKGPRTT
jgi:hypothetical protein